MIKILGIDFHIVILSGAKDLIAQNDFIKLNFKQNNFYFFQFNLSS